MSETDRISRDALRRSYLERFLIAGVVSSRTFMDTYANDAAHAGQALKRLRAR